MKLKPLLPTLRQKKRYLAIEVISEKSISQKQAIQTIRNAIQNFLGTYGTAQAELIFLEKKSTDNRILVKVAHNMVDHVRAALITINTLEVKQNIIARSLGASGILNTAYKKYILEG